MARMGLTSVMALMLLFTVSAITAQGREVLMKNPLCMWVTETDPPACLADIFGNVKNEQVLAESAALRECPTKANQKDCEKAVNCFWDAANGRCTQDSVTLNQECYTPGWNTIQRTFQCPQFSTEEKCSGDVEGCNWDDAKTCAIDEDAVQKAVTANATIAAELDQFQTCLEADNCAPPCVSDPPTVDCFYRELFNPARFTVKNPSPYCQLQAARATCVTAANCSTLPDCAPLEQGDCVITPQAIVKYTLADNPKVQKKVNKALTECVNFTTEQDCLAHK